MISETIPVSEFASIDPEQLDAFLAGFHGTIVRPGDSEYDQARIVRNGLINRHPAMIARCAGVADVIDAVNFAREHRLLLSVRGGGHNVAGNAVNDDGIVIDLSAMRAVHVDPIARTARAQGGATWGDLDRETQLYGLAAPGGVVSSTGIGGLTLHGGLGHLRRTHGLSLDNLLSVEIVTADGHVQRASTDENPDLFWAVRGAGSNFGVITSFEFKLHSVGPMLSLCAPFYALEDGRQVLRAWRDFTQTAPDAISSLAVLWSVPDNEHFPEELRRRPVVVLGTVYDGPADEGAAAMQPLRELATPLMDLSGPIPYTALQQAFDPFFPVGSLYYWKSTYIDTLSDEAIDVMLERARIRPSHLTDITFWHLGGAIGRVDESSTSFGRRSAPYLFAAESSWTDPADNERNIAWSRDSLKAMQPFSHGGLYLNFPGFGEEKEAMLRAAYGSGYERLVALKRRYDPGNLFRMNLNINPGV
jgi:FAD/FMN-containing dehydrogenase